MMLTMFLFKFVWMSVKEAGLVYHISKFSSLVFFFFFFFAHFEMKSTNVLLRRT